MFACCCCPRPHIGSEQPVLDVAKILQDYVWRNYKNLPENRLARPFLWRKNYAVDVPMGYFVFETLPHRQELTPRVRPELAELSKILDSKNKDRKVNENEKLVTSDTYYENNTNMDQTYKFRLEKTRKASLNVTFTRGFTVNGNARFSIKLPASDSGPSGDLGCTFNISKATTEVIEESVVLETTSDIHVEKKTKFVAKVALAESEVMYDFKVCTLMRFASDCALGTVTRKSDNRVFYSTAIKNLNDVFKGFVKKSHVKIIPLDTKHETQQYAVELTTVGVLDGVRLSNQYIFLESQKLSGEQVGAKFVYSDSAARKWESTPVIEELDEGDGGGSDPAPHFSLGPPPIPSIVMTSPNSVCSSPISERELSDTSDASRSTTV